MKHMLFLFLIIFTFIFLTPRNLAKCAPSDQGCVPGCKYLNENCAKEHCCESENLVCDQEGTVCKRNLWETCTNNNDCLHSCTCGSDGKCCKSAGYMCATGECCAETFCENNTCCHKVINADCNNDQDCCASAQLTCDINQKKCKKKTGASCTETDDCGSNAFCENGHCIKECVNDSDCGKKGLCINYLCKVLPGGSCKANNDCLCTEGTTYEGGKIDCIAEHLQTTCLNNVCCNAPGGKCSALNDCCSPSVCENGYCS